MVMELMNVMFLIIYLKLPQDDKHLPSALNITFNIKLSSCHHPRTVDPVIKVCFPFFSCSSTSLANFILLNHALGIACMSFLKILHYTRACLLQFHSFTYILAAFSFCNAFQYNEVNNRI